MEIGDFSDLVFRLTNSAIETRPGEHQKSQVEILKDHFQFDAAWWGWSNFSAGRNRLINTGLLDLPTSFESAVRAGLHVDPLVQYGRNLAVFGKTVDVENDELPPDFRNLLDAYQISSVLSGHCRLQGKTQFNFFLSLYIRSGEKKFSEAEAGDFRLILRHIEQNLSLSLRTELRGLAPDDGEAAFVSVGGAVVRATRGFKAGLIEAGLNETAKADLLADMSFGLRRWEGGGIALEGSAYQRDLVLIRMMPKDKLVRLSQQEGIVADLLLKGLTMKEIAAKKGVAHNTVRNQVSAIYRKTGAKNRASFVSLMQKK